MANNVPDSRTPRKFMNVRTMIISTAIITLCSPTKGMMDAVLATAAATETATVRT